MLSLSISEAVQIVSVTYLQRNMSAPAFAPSNTVCKSDLTVVAEDLTSFIEGLNDLWYLYPIMSNTKKADVIVRL